MQHRGIDFDIKVTIEHGQWVWVVHTPKPSQGKFKGTREQVTLYAKTAIDVWCLRNPRAYEKEIRIG
jgi:hypothetical protein